MPAHCHLNDVRAALSLPDFDGFGAQRRMMPFGRPVGRAGDLAGTPRLGAVLLLLYCAYGKLHLVLTKRSDYDGVHGGQISFPGGRHEPPETLTTTALRETREELGVDPANVQFLGELTPLYVVPSNFEVYPFVSYFMGEERPRFVPDIREVAAVLEVSLDTFLDPATCALEDMEIRGGLRLRVPCFRVGEYRVWGATAMILSELLERLRYVRYVATHLAETASGAA